MPNDAPVKKCKPTPFGRVLLLVACIVAGCVIGFVGQFFTGSSTWFLAVPGLMALAWLFVAHPDECLPDGQCRRRNDSA